MLNFKKSFVVLTCCLASGLSSYSMNALAEEPSFHCENTNQCNLAAQLCGQIAGTTVGRDICQSKSSAPHPDFVWQREVKFLHCMGYLPIIATLNDDVLYNLFITGYQSTFAASYKAAGCQSN